MEAFGDEQRRITLDGREERLWRCRLAESGREFAIGAPQFEVDGALRTMSLGGLRRTADPLPQPNGCVEHRFSGEAAEDPDLSLDLVFRVADRDPVVRFRYVLRSRSAHRLTKTSGADRLSYLTLSLADMPEVTEIRLGEFTEMVHSYTLVERRVEGRQFEHGIALIGPVLAAHDRSHAVLIAYEHGATAPDSFLEFRPTGERAVSLSAVKGNYLDGQALDPDHPYETVWLEFAAVPGDTGALARAYRQFALRRLSVNAESRRPFIFYNTWNYQEKNRHWHGRPYLESMNETRMIEEIEVAQRLGVDVFVIDTGWYEKAGDWRVSRERFPNGLGPIREKLGGYGMKLGLWFNPTAAAVSSQTLARHEDCVKSWRGERGRPFAVWETEDSRPMCLVSRYWKAFAGELIRLHREEGVTYLKWDAVDQYGCDDPGHDHGGPGNSPQERADCFAFRLGQAMVRIAEAVQQACPEAIVDFDVTEAGRFVGLGWLAASKYHLVNNGPYYPDYNLPLPPDQNWNMFFYPGPARGWICRTPLSYDRWVPSVLFLTHYLPDEPESSQLINFGSLILGQNGVWGDLPGLSEEALARFGALIARYRQVRDDITAAYPVRSGPVAGTPEVHEKISEESGRGAVVIFSTRRGRYFYITENRTVETWWHTEGVAVSRDARGRARIEASFNEPGAKMVLFGVAGGGARGQGEFAEGA